MKLILTAIALIGFLENDNSNIFTAQKKMRVAVGRDQQTGTILYKLEDNSGPVKDGFKEVDVSYMAIDDGHRKVLFVQNQNVIDALQMNEDEINDFARVLTQLHTTGFHFATAGVMDQTYRKTITMFVNVHGKTWTAYDATARSGVEGFQPLENGKMAIRYADTLGQMEIGVVMQTIVDNRQIEFSTDTLDVPKNAILAPRFANQNAELIMGYVDLNTKTTVTAEQSGDKLLVNASAHQDDVVGDALPFASLGSDGRVTKKIGLIGFDTSSGKTTLQTGLAWRDVFALRVQDSPSTGATAK